MAKNTDDQIREIRDALYLFAECQMKDMKIREYKKRNDGNGTSNSSQVNG